MKRSSMLIVVVAVLVAVFIPRQGVAQIVYGTYNDGGNTYVIMIDLATCMRCNVLVLPHTPNSDLSILPDGRIVLLRTGSSSELLLYTPPSPTPTVVVVDPPFSLHGSLWYNGSLYLIGTNGLYVFDPVTNQTTHLGNWPTGMQGGGYEPYAFNGQMYAMSISGVPQTIWLIDIINPSNSTFVQQIQGVGNPINALTSVDFTVIFASHTWLYSYNHIDNSHSTMCTLVSLGIPNDFVNGLTYLPPGADPPPCIVCTTAAGTLTSGATNYCINVLAQVPHNNNAQLDLNDLLQFILYTNSANPIGSTIATSNTPQFNFVNPPMQMGVPYYVAAIAGNDLNGSVDLADPCLSVSNAAQIIWRPLPSVSFSAANTDLCAGQCATVTAVFTGSPPFTLTYTTPFSGPITQTFPASPGTFQVCVPAGAPAGPLSVQATELTDAWCTCHN